MAIGLLVSDGDRHVSGSVATAARHRSKSGPLIGFASAGLASAGLTSEGLTSEGLASEGLASGGASSFRRSGCRLGGDSGCCNVLLLLPGAGGATAFGTGAGIAAWAAVNRTLQQFLVSPTQRRDLLRQPLDFGLLGRQQLLRRAAEPVISCRRASRDRPAPGISRRLRQPSVPSATARSDRHQRSARSRPIRYLFHANNAMIRIRRQPPSGLLVFRLVKVVLYGVGIASSSGTSPGTPHTRNECACR